MHQNDNDFTKGIIYLDIKEHYQTPSMVRLDDILNRARSYGVLLNATPTQEILDENDLLVFYPLSKTLSFNEYTSEITDFLLNKEKVSAEYLFSVVEDAIDEIKLEQEDAFDEYYNHSKMSDEDFNKHYEDMVESLLQDGLRPRLKEDFKEKCTNGTLEYINGTLKFTSEDEEAKTSIFEFSEDFLKYTDNLSERAQKGLIDPVIGRESELELVVKSLSRYRKNNPLLIGESGVGKTSIIDKLVLAIHNEDKCIPEELLNKTVISLDPGKVMAGTNLRGDLEKRINTCLSEVVSHGDVILFIDEIHSITQNSGHEGGSSMDVANLLKPYLTQKGVRIMGATTYKEYKNIFEKDVAMPRRFQKIEVEEPTLGETKEILKGLRDNYSQYHGVVYTDEMIDRIVDKTDKHILKGMLPDKAIDIMDLVGVGVKFSDNNKIGKDDIDKVISTVARIPTEQVSSSEGNKLATLAKSLKTQVFGQDETIDKVAELIKINRSGLGDTDKPIASLLFTGGSGTGKTELSKQLATQLGSKLIRFDMSEYSNETSISKLIGANAGYVGYSEGGLLTEAVIKNPNAVILLDEIEKAHPIVFTTLLQVMDNATLTDNSGRIADFRNIVLIMTTNTGARQAEETKQGIGFHACEEDSKAEVQDEALKEMFAPEFRNRLDAICKFNNLDESVIKSIAKKFLSEVKVVAEQRNIKLKFTTSFINYLCDNGVDTAMGARPMKRLIADSVKKPLSDIIIAGENNGKTVTFGFSKDEVTVKSN